MSPLEQVAASLVLSAEEYRTTAELLETAERIAVQAQVVLDEQARLGLAAHLASLMRRLKAGEKVDGVAPELFDEVPETYRTMATDLIGPMYQKAGMALDPTEIGLVALHFAAAHERTKN